MKHVLKWMKRMVFAVVFLATLLGVTGLALLHWPNFWFNESTLKFAAKIAAMEGVYLRWDSLRVSTEKNGFFDPKISFQSKGFSVPTSR